MGSYSSLTGQHYNNEKQKREYEKVYLANIEKQKLAELKKANGSNDSLDIQSWEDVKMYLQIFLVGGLVIGAFIGIGLLIMKLAGINF